MIVGCSDGAVYVWQMETGHLDRVLHGLLIPFILIFFFFLNLSVFVQFVIFFAVLNTLIAMLLY